MVYLSELWFAYQSTESNLHSPKEKKMNSFVGVVLIYESVIIRRHPINYTISSMPVDCHNFSFWDGLLPWLSKDLWFSKVTFTPWCFGTPFFTFYKDYFVYSNHQRAKYSNKKKSIFWYVLKSMFLSLYFLCHSLIKYVIK